MVGEEEDEHDPAEGDNERLAPVHQPQDMRFVLCRFQSTFFGIFLLQQ
jgi:hypothetical protein